MNRISLRFLSNEVSAELFETEFSCPLVGRTLRCARGRQAFSDSLDGTFQWTSAVQSMSAAAIKSKLVDLARSTPQAWPQEAGLCSDETTWALSLDYALSKKPRWLLDMFGVDGSGSPIIKRLFLRMNPEKKRPGPSWVSINPGFLEPRNIAIYLDGVEVATEPELTALLKRIGLNGGEGSNGGKVSSSPPVQTGSERGLRGEPENSDSVVHSISRTLFGDPWWVTTLSGVIREEVATMLADHSIFRPEALQGELASIYRSSAYRAVAAKNLQLTSEIDLKLGSSARLGVIERDLCSKTLSALGRPLNISLAITLVPSLALFSYLQHERGIPLNVKYHYAHSLEVIRSIEQGNSSAPPDALVMGLMPAVSFLSQRRRPSYRPLMVMPKASNRLVTSRDAQGSKGARFVLPSDHPTSASFILDSMFASGRIARRLTKIEHLEPDEIIVKLHKSVEDFRSIQWFPHYQLNRLLHGCHLFQSESHTEDLPTILLVHEKLMYNEGLVTALDVALRDAWLRLRSGGSCLDTIINRLVSDPEYLELFTRYTGLYAFDKKFFQKAKEELHACG